MSNLKIAFFGTSEVAVAVLEDLKANALMPSLIITNPDKPQGRKFVITPPPVKVWADLNQIRALQPEKLDSVFIQTLKGEPWDLFIVVAYGKIIPLEILEIPKHQSLNVHYSLLPKLRGSSPVEGAILNDERETGVSIILMDSKMDHGPILAQEKVMVESWPPTRTQLMNEMNKVAGKLLAQTIFKWTNGEIVPTEQDHNEATFVKMIKKEDALIDLNDDPYLNFRKIQAYEKWPRAYFIKNNKRVIINNAQWKDGRLDILKITPEGKKEMSYSDFLKS